MTELEFLVVMLCIAVIVNIGLWADRRSNRKARRRL